MAKGSVPEALTANGSNRLDHRAGFTLFPLVDIRCKAAK